MVCGDVCQTNLGLSSEAYDVLAKRVTHIIHTAADWRLIPIEELRKTNVQGTLNVLDLARKANAHHQVRTVFPHFHGLCCWRVEQEKVPEDALTDEFGFFTDYEQSKYEGEMLGPSSQKGISSFYFSSLPWLSAIPKQAPSKHSTHSTFRCGFT